MNGHKKVKDLFIDEKISFSQRQKIPLFFSGGKLFWVAGIRKGGADRSYSPDASRVRVQLLEFMQNAAMLA
jgi:tRNA(Ile)-lysidine synthase